MTDQYRLIESYGPYFNKRWEVQEKYSYYDTDNKKIEAWHMVFHSEDKEKCEKVLNKYLSSEPRKHFQLDELIF